MIYRILVLLMFCSICSNVFAADLKTSIDEVINKNPLSKTATIAVKIIEQDSKKVLYSKNTNKLVHPASTLKVATSGMVFKELGKKYKLTTALYEKDDKLYIKLSGNPLFKKSDLSKLFKNVDVKKYDTIVIDNTIIDGRFIGTGWMWDNFLAEETPHYSVFNIDGNVVELNITPNKAINKVQIVADYPQEIRNYLYVSNKKTNIKVESKPWLHQNAVYLSGPVARKTVKKIAVKRPKDYFLHRLNQVIPEFSGQIYYGLIPNKAKLIKKHEDSLMKILCDLNKNSNNMSAETMFKIAAAEHYNQQGTTEKAIKLFDEFYDKPDADIVDASGLSHNNLLSVDFLNSVLVQFCEDSDFRSTLAVPSKEGTLEKRLEGLKIQGKTGTLSGVSGICGYLKSKSGKNYIFTILIQNYKGRAKKAKLLEDAILKQLNWF